MRRQDLFTAPQDPSGVKRSAIEPLSIECQCPRNRRAYHSCWVVYASEKILVLTDQGLKVWLLAPAAANDQFSGKRRQGSAKRVSREGSMAFSHVTLI